MIEDLVKQITELIDELNECSDTSGSLFIYGDLNSGFVAGNTRGSTYTTAMAFCNRMDANEKFKDVCMSLFASYLVNNPSDKAMFLEALELNPEIKSESRESLEDQLKKAVEEEDFERASEIKKLLGG